MPDHPSAADERRHARELEAAMRSVARLRREQGLAPVVALHALPGKRRTGPPLGWGAGVIGALAGLLIALGPGDDGSGPDRYEQPPQFTPGEGTYAFLGTQPTGSDPVGFNPCRPVDYVVNPAGAPPDWRELIRDGVAHLEWASGLDLRDAGTTTQRPFNPLQTDGALGQRPVVIGFADEEELPRLAGSVAGLGGGIRDVDAVGYTYYKGGSIALDTDVFDGPSSGGVRDRLQGIVDHELGHVVGLDHVDDAGELMDAGSGTRTDFGPGDLEGLSLLGAIPCS